MAGRFLDAPRWRKSAFATALVAVGVVALVVFAPWRPPGLVSDAWFINAHFGRLPATDLAAIYLPSAGFWYRPLTYTGFWLEWHAFGSDPLGWYIVQLSAHVLASILVGAVARTLIRNRWAALAAGLAFLFTLQAGEVVWDYSSLHRVLSAVVVPATVLAYVRERRLFALIGASCAVLVDESGVIVLPLLVSYELLFQFDRSAWRPAFTSAARRLAPVIAVTVVYGASRLLAGGVFNELATPCRSVPCIAVASAEYLNRLVVRGDDLLRFLWTDRPVIGLAVVALGVLVLVVLRPWRWADWRPLAFGVVWAALGSALFILTLWPYVADRFVYVPAMGVALAIGAVVGGVLDIWPRAAVARRGALVAGVLVLVVWLSAGAISLADRGRRSVDAGDLARVLRSDLYAQLPTPAPGTQVLVWDVPRMLSPTFLPGNTGPYVYINGIEWAMRLEYGWPPDVIVPSRPELYTVDPDKPLFEFEVVDGHVVPRNPG